MDDSRIWRLPLAVAVMGLLFGRSFAVGITDFDWESITPSATLSYKPCYQDLQCARLVVPLDWQNSNAGHNVTLAIAKLPATVAEGDPAFGGTIFTNPGGPGGSGISQIIQSGRKLQNVTGGQYEILGWDPRGVGFTTPRADCYDGDIAARDVAALQTNAIGPLDASDDAFRRRWAAAKATGQLCEATMKEDSILPYLSTASVVRDMVEMLDQIHALRSPPAPEFEPLNMVKVLKPADAPRIMYWGFSYGSFLGNAFASMYPGRVGRMILDGIVDADDYVKGTWLSNLHDAEDIVDDFYRGCFSPEHDCSLKRPSDTQWEDIKERVDHFITQTNQEPISIIENHEITLITGADIRRAFITPLYKPVDSFVPLSNLLNDALAGNYTLLRADMADSLPKLHDACAQPNSSTLATLTGRDAWSAIKCSDGEDETGHAGVAYWQSYLEELKSQSQTMGEHWAKIRLACAGWTARPDWRFTGPFTTPEHDRSLVRGKPAAPLLFLSSRLDPVTPLRNAVAMAGRHPGAALVIQDNAGHCAASAPSACTRDIIRGYLGKDGVVPDNGTVCSPDCDPWRPCPQLDGSGALFHTEHFFL